MSQTEAAALVVTADRQWGNRTHIPSRVHLATQTGMLIPFGVPPAFRKE